MIFTKVKLLKGYQQHDAGDVIDIPGPATGHASVLVGYGIAALYDEPRPDQTGGGVMETGKDEPPVKPVADILKPPLKPPAKKVVRRGGAAKKPSPRK